jgi:hypothetical protein
VSSQKLLNPLDFLIERAISRLPLQFDLVASVDNRV